MYTILFSKIWEYLGVRGLIIIALAIYAGSAYFIMGHQSSKIDELETSNAAYVATNKSLAGKIDEQNSALRDGEEKYRKTQSALDKANGVNQALGAEFDKFRRDLGNKPLPVTCPDSIQDIKTIIRPLAKDWNNK